MRAVANIHLGPEPGAAARGSLIGNAAGFGTMAGLHRALSAHSDTDIIVDLSRVGWVDGHLTAALDTVFRKAGSRGNAVSLTGMAPRLRDTFCKNHLILARKPDRFNTVMPITAFEEDDGPAFSWYAKRHLDRPEMPRMTTALRRRFFEGLDELFANAVLHAHATQPIIVGGQYYPRAHRLAFCMADGGQGIPSAVRAKLGDAQSAEDAIAWAMEPYNTTRLGDIPGGLGSKVLRDFIALNGGQMTIVSGGGFWRQTGAQACKRALGAPYPGTVVVLEIDTSDRQPYDLDEAPDPYSIW
ncbi:hypothetical protein MMSR116_08715 [Methylobacterium mesophilicum SR1.6/6]|uniref:STAS domain-containing protein n=1 Tax=Methylobacterium mesophilicum SR1.6/6 TaxID=908290 RepID=A0A6B9FJ10_9HYPH|nr:hypothetical protein [Methylobacterium mesophilicum]QGY01949.1 hypothetical protein MMSR116_08715 [Methylobacterium mesophilicum SR1.6/6]